MVFVVFFSQDSGVYYLLLLLLLFVCLFVCLFIHIYSCSVEIHH